MKFGGQLYDKIGTSIHTHNTGVLNIHQIGIGYNAYSSSIPWIGMYLSHTWLFIPLLSMQVANSYAIVSIAIV